MYNCKYFANYSVFKNNRVQIFELLEYGKQIWDGKRNGHKPTGSLRRREIGPGTFE